MSPAARWRAAGLFLVDIGAPSARKVALPANAKLVRKDLLFANECNQFHMIVGLGSVDIL